MPEAAAEVQDIRMAEEERLQAEDESTQPRDNTTATRGRTETAARNREEKRKEL